MFSLQQLILSVIASAVGSYVFYFLLAKRKSALRQRLEDLDNEQEFLERISRGNIFLLRQSFKVLFFTLSLFYLIVTMLLIISVFSISNNVSIQIKAILVGFSSISAILCFSFFRSIMKISDLPKEKKKIKSKKEKIQRKLNDNV